MLPRNPPTMGKQHAAVQGTNEDLMALLGKHDAEERSVAATVQMLRLLGVASAEMQVTFVAGREAHMQATLQAARLQAHAAILSASGCSDAMREAPPWPGLLPFLESLGRSVFPTLSQVPLLHACCHHCMAMPVMLPLPCVSLLPYAT